MTLPATRLHSASVNGSSDASKMRSTSGSIVEEVEAEDRNRWREAGGEKPETTTMKERMHALLLHHITALR